jgi:hypothetical protein
MGGIVKKSKAFGDENHKPQTRRKTTLRNSDMRLIWRELGQRVTTSTRSLRGSLGSGRGTPAFNWALTFGARVVGVEVVPLRFAIAHNFALMLEQYNSKARVAFVCGNMAVPVTDVDAQVLSMGFAGYPSTKSSEVTWKTVTVWYCWDTGMPPKARESMFKTVKLLLQKGSLRVVVSYFNDWATKGQMLHGLVCRVGHSQTCSSTISAVVCFLSESWV